MDRSRRFAQAGGGGGAAATVRCGSARRECRLGQRHGFNVVRAFRFAMTVTALCNCVCVFGKPRARSKHTHTQTQTNMKHILVSWQSFIICRAQLRQHPIYPRQNLFVSCTLALRMTCASRSCCLDRSSGRLSISSANDVLPLVSRMRDCEMDASRLTKANDNETCLAVTGWARLGAAHTVSL